MTKRVGMAMSTIPLCLPLVQFLNLFCSKRKEHPKKMGEECLPVSEVKFV